MSIFSSIGNFFGGLFGGDDDKKKKQQQNQPRQSSAAPLQKPTPSYSNAGNVAQNQNPASLPQLNQRPDNGVNLLSLNPTQKPLTGLQILQKPTQAPATPTVDQQKTAELDRLTKSNLDAARKQRSQGESWWNRNVPIFSNKGDIERDAEVLARSRATNQYQEQHGWVKDPTVLAYGKRTTELGNEHAADLKKSAETLNTVQKVATKGAQIAQWVPVTGTVLNWGLAEEANRARAEGRTADAQALDEQRNMNEFGMSPEEYNKLDANTKHKLQVMRNVGYGLGVLDFTGLAGLAKSEGVNLAKDSAIQFAKEGAIDAAKKEALQTLGKDTAINLAKTTGTGTAISLGGQYYMNDGTPTERLKKLNPLEAAKTGLMIAGTNELFNPTELRKAGTNNVAATIDEAGHPGVKSANPSKAVDAAKQVQDQAMTAATNTGRMTNDIPTDLTTPAYLRKADKAAAAAESARQADATARDLGVGNTAVDDVPAFQHKRDIQAAIDDGNQVLTDWVNENPNHTPQQLEAAKAEIQRQTVEKITQLQNDRAAALNGPEPAAAAPTPQVTPVMPQEPAAAAPPAPVAAQAAGTPELATSAEQAPTPAPATAPGPLPAVPQTNAATPSGPQVPTAPRQREAVLKQMGDLAKELPKEGAMRDPVNIQNLFDAGRGVVNNMSDAEALDLFGSSEIANLPHNEGSFSILKAGREKLSDALKNMAPDDPARDGIKSALGNIMDEMEARVSKSGLMQRLAQEEFDAMPLEAKVRYLARKIDAANKEVPGYEPLARRPEDLAAVEANLTAALTKAQSTADRIAALEDQINGAADAARNGQRVDTKAAQAELRQLRDDLQVKNGDVVKYFQTLVPGRTKAQRALVDFPKRMMLASGLGRVNDILTTGANVADLGVNNLIQGVVGGVTNLVKGKGTVTNTFKGNSKLAKAIPGAFRKFKSEAKGDVRVGDIAHNLKGAEDLRSGLRKPSGPVGRTIQAATEFATNLSEGVKDQRLYQLADQEAAQLGLSGQMRKQYAEARAAVPTRQMVDAAETLHKQINNLNDNPISRTLNKIGQAMEGDNKFGRSGIGGVLKNQVIPFTSWLGGNFWNTVTDRNLVANGFKTIRDIARGDTEGAVRNLSRTANSAIQAYVIGYQLAKNGMLTNTDAEGNNDGGMYVHVGDRYIPVGMFGFFAPNIVLGKFAHDGLNSDDPVGTMAADIGNYAWHGLAVPNILGVDNGLNRAVDTANSPGHNAVDGAAVFGGSVAGQYIPAGTGDINSVLNNSPLNPTHEAPQTRVQSDGLTPTGRPSKAKDVPASTLASLQSRIPILSQQLPRKAGVPADDPLDRITKGDRESGTQVAAREQAKTEAQQAEDRKKRGVPESAEAIEAKWQNGDFDMAIEGTKYVMDKAKKDGKLSRKDQENYEQNIRQYETMRDNKYTYDDWKLYDKTDLTDWRNYGDPESDSYNPDLYKKLWEMDEAFTKNKASDSSKGNDVSKYSAKKSKSGSGGGRGGSKKDPELARIQSNTVGDLPKLGSLSLGELDKLQKPSSSSQTQLPQLKKLVSSDLVKKRKITISR